MANFLDELVKAIKGAKDSEGFERDFEQFSTTGVPRNVLRCAGLERRYHPAKARKKDEEPLRKRDYKNAPANMIGDSQIAYLNKHYSEEEQC